MLEPRYSLQESPALHLVEEINHRVINEYTDLICTLSVAAMRSKSNKTKQQLTYVADRVRAFAQSHKALLPPQGSLSAELGEYISGICTRMTEATLRERGVRIELKTEAVFVSADKCWRIGLVVAELIRNSCKHGFSGGSGRILISITRSEGKICCHVRDNGVSKAANASGRGCRLTALLAAELGGDIEWNFEADGSAATLRVPSADFATS